MFRNEEESHKNSLQTLNQLHDKVILEKGYVDHKDLVLSRIDKSLSRMSTQ